MAHCIIVISLHPPSSPFAPSASALPSIPSPAPAHPFIQDASNERVPSSLPPPAFLYARGRILADVPCGRALLLRTRRSQHQDKHRQQLNTLITQIIEIWLQYCYLSMRSAMLNAALAFFPIWLMRAVLFMLLPSFRASLLMGWRRDPKASIYI